MSHKSNKYFRLKMSVHVQVTIVFLQTSIFYGYGYTHVLKNGKWVHAEYSRIRSTTPLDRRDTGRKWAHGEGEGHSCLLYDIFLPSIFFFLIFSIYLSTTIGVFLCFTWSYWSKTFLWKSEKRKTCILIRYGAWFCAAKINFKKCCLHGKICVRLWSIVMSYDGPRRQTTILP